MLPDFSVDEQERIYSEFDNIHIFFGWIEVDHDTGNNGGDIAVHAQYANASSGFYNYPENTSFFQPSIEFSPALVFHIKPDGTVYRRIRGSIKIIAEIEGTSNLYTIAGLALAVLL